MHACMHCVCSCVVLHRCRWVGVGKWGALQCGRAARWGAAGGWVGRLGGGVKARGMRWLAMDNANAQRP